MAYHWKVFFCCPFSQLAFSLCNLRILSLGRETALEYGITRNGVCQARNEIRLNCVLESHASRCGAEF